MYVFTPNKVKRYDNLTNQWDTSPIAVSILDSMGNNVLFADPSAYVNVSGRICLFFLNTTGIFGDPAQCLSPPCTAYFDSATEVAGSDGTQFIKQSGHRIANTTNSNFKPTDPDLFKKDNTYYQYISYGNGTIVYSSNTLHGNYTLMGSLPNGYLTNTNAGIPCGMFHQSANLYYSYGHRNSANGSEIMLAKHTDFNAQANYNIVFTGSSIGLGNVQVASPGICENSFLGTNLSDIIVASGLHLFPNSSTGNFSIQSDKNLSKLVIYDLSGKMIRSYLKLTARQAILLDDLKKGLYIVQYSDCDNHIYHSKIIIQSLSYEKSFIPSLSFICKFRGGPTYEFYFTHYCDQYQRTNDCG